ncbi:DUF2071 domain-containing protein [Roseivirga misakiensis]|uniref:DUF2071 domain-containing protein n=1 Tax=Roseivirga misakiensis TaxID=1563681 RepID=A0A1E5SKS5_9BACT|nr:DUF2071 domain-containing protein [Roseivirga misakiensis]OEJ99722.1 hypothetical protein BFP71_09135 [Roseivirga misakiensis]
MKFLKKIPITYSGTLNDVKLVNFSVAMDEVLPLVPKEIKVLDFNGRAVISMVNVKLKQMRPSFFPKWLSFEYQHVAFRLLVDDTNLNSGKAKGIYFLKSFTNKPLISVFGNLLSHYKLSNAEIHDVYGFDLWQNKKFLHYNLNEKTPLQKEWLKTSIGAIDRAYAVDNSSIYCTLIQREKWPIEWVNCIGFKTNFFKTAEFLGAFSVNEVIDYKWLPAKKISALL